MCLLPYSSRNIHRNFSTLQLPLTPNTRNIASFHTPESYTFVTVDMEEYDHSAFQKVSGSTPLLLPFPPISHHDPICHGLPHDSASMNPAQLSDLTGASLSSLAPTAGSRSQSSTSTAPSRSTANFSAGTSLPHQPWASPMRELT